MNYRVWAIDVDEMRMMYVHVTNIGQIHSFVSMRKIVDDGNDDDQA
jgi:hypothetical protein